MITSATPTTEYTSKRRHIRLRWWYFKCKWLPHPSNRQYFCSRLFKHNGTVFYVWFSKKTFISSLNLVIADSLVSLLVVTLKLIQMEVFMKKLRHEKNQIWLMISKRNFIQKQLLIKITWPWFWPRVTQHRHTTNQQGTYIILRLLLSRIFLARLMKVNWKEENTEMILQKKGSVMTMVLNSNLRWGKHFEIFISYKILF